jgi:hypothetical protein
LGLLATVGIAPAVRAAPTPQDAAAAQALFDQGKELSAQGKYTEACPKFEQSQTLDPGTGTLFHLADCWEHVGRTATAWATFLEVANESRAAGRLDREQIARARRAALEPRLSRLSIIVTEDTPGLTVTRDGQPVTPDLWGLPVPVDLGWHAITARASGRRPWNGTAQVTAEGLDFNTVVPALPKAPNIASRAWGEQAH